MNNWFNGLYFIPRNKLLPELIKRDGSRTPLNQINKIEGLMDLVKESFIYDHPNPTIIYNGTHNIPNLDKLFISKQHKTILKSHQVDFFFFEVLTHYIPNNHGRLEPHILKIDNEPEKLNKIRCYELDTLDAWAKEHDIKLHVHCTDYMSTEHYKNIYKNITLKNTDLFISWCSDRFAMQERFNERGLMPGDQYPPTDHLTRRMKSKFWSGSWRYDPTRHFITSFLAGKNLIKGNHVSFYFDIPTEEMKRRMWFNWDEFETKYTDLAETMCKGNEELRKLVPLSFDVTNPLKCGVDQSDPDYDTPAQYNNRQTQDPVDTYEKCFCVIINESRVTQPWPNISEKTFNPIKSIRPFVMVAAPGTLKMLKEMGFKTFDKYWPEDYDDIVRTSDRLARITEIIDYISQYDIQEMRQMYLQMLPDLLHNYHQIKKLRKFYGKLNKRI